MAEKSLLAKLADAIRPRRKSLESYVTALALALIFIVAIIARLGPMKWAYQIAEVDPWFYFFSAKYMLVNGFSAWFHWRNPLEWYPYGQFIPAFDSPMLPIASVATYDFVRLLGINVSFYNFAVMIPVVFTALSCVFLYFLGKEIGGTKTGILAALFLAVSAANIQQTMLGEFKEEFLSFFFYIPSMYFLIRSLRTKDSKRMIYSGVLAALSVASWGPVGAYMYDMPALIVIVGIVTGRISPETGFKILAFVTAPALLTAASIQRNVAGVASLSGDIVVAGAFFLTALRRLYNGLSENSRPTFKVFFVFLVIGVLGGTAVLLPTAIGGRLLAIVLPFTRAAQAIVNTVAENELTTWADFYLGFGLQMIFIPAAAYLFIRRRDAVGISMVLFVLTAVYFTASYVRAEEILTPIAAISAAYVLARLIDAYSPLIRKAYRTTSSNRSTNAPVDWEIGGILLVLLVVSMGFFAYQGVVSGASPPLMLQVGGSINNDWPMALTWLRYNTPSNSIVASWWDYGYWIMVGANRTTLADPSTTNTTQIQYLAVALMSNASVAEKILSFYHVNYILIYQPVASASSFEYPSLDGDLAKSGAMLTIANSVNNQKLNEVFGLNLNTSELFSNQSYYLTQAPDGIILPNGHYAGQPLLYQLMFGSDSGLQYYMSQLASQLSSTYSMSISVPSYSVPAGFTLAYATPDLAIQIYQMSSNITV